MVIYDCFIEDNKKWRKYLCSQRSDCTDCHTSSHDIFCLFVYSSHRSHVVICNQQGLLGCILYICFCWCCSVSTVLSESEHLIRFIAICGLSFSFSYEGVWCCCNCLFCQASFKWSVLPCHRRYDKETLLNILCSYGANYLPNMWQRIFA